MRFLGSYVRMRNVSCRCPKCYNTLAALDSIRPMETDSRLSYYFWECCVYSEKLLE